MQIPAKLPWHSIVLVLSLALFTRAISQETQSPLVVFLVRHAEKADTSTDAQLTPAGTARAQQLATILRDAGIKEIHSSDYSRTRNTAAPLAKLLSLPVKLYDPRKLSPLVTKLKAIGGRHLVVGHSNTTPNLAKLLGGTSGPAIIEKTEFDRLYIITIDQDKEVSTVLLRYGTP